MYFAVIDTNVLISALLSKKPDTATVKILRKILDGTIRPLLNEKILEEYDDVFHRPQFHLQEKTIQKVFNAIQQFGIEMEPEPSTTEMIDEDDRIFLDTAAMKEGTFLITGNTKHFPKLSFIVTPAQMLNVIDN